MPPQVPPQHRITLPACQGGTPPRASPQPGGPYGSAPATATSLARATLLHERPHVVERMEKGVAVCAVLRDNRQFRLNSLGACARAWAGLGSGCVCAGRGQSTSNANRWQW